MAVLVVCVASLLPLATSPAEAQGGPLPEFSSVSVFLATLSADAGASEQALFDYAESAQRHGDDVVRGFVEESTLKASSIEAMLSEGGTTGAAVVSNTGHTAVAGIGSVAGASVAAQAYAGYLSDLGRRMLGVEGSGTPPFAEAGQHGPCVTDLQAALDAARPGDHVIACAGTYGPLVVSTEFVTLRSDQGAAATFVDGNGTDAIQVRASGVRVSGFTVFGAGGPRAAGIAVGDAVDMPDQTVWGVMIEGNVIQENTIGVDLRNATGTVIVGNTVEGSTRAVDSYGGMGVRLVARLGPGEYDTARHGTLVAANNLLSNQGYAIGIVGGPARPVVAAMNHYGSEMPPSFETVAGMCTTLLGVPQPAPCANGHSAGVVLAGWSPAGV